MRHGVASSKKKGLPLNLLAVSLSWAIYWLPGISPGIIGLLKDLFLFIMLVMLLLPKQITLHNLTTYKGQKHYLVFSNLLIAIAILTFIMGVIFSPNPAGSFTFWTRFVGAYLLYKALSGFYRKNPQFLEISFKVLTAPVILSVIYMISSMMGIINIPIPKTFKTSYDFILKPYMMGLSYRSNAMGWAISFVLPIMVYFSFKAGSIPEKWLWRSSAAGSLYIVSLVKGRGAVVSAMLSSGFIAWMLLRNKRTERFIIALVALILIVGVGIPYLSSIFLWKIQMSEGEAHWSDLFEKPENFDDFSSGRYTIFVKAFRTIKKAPLTGIGIGQTDEYGFSSGTAHNFFLNTFSGSGIFAGVVALLFFIKVGILCYNVIRTKEILNKNNFIIVPVAMVISFFPSILVEGGPMFGSLYQGITFWYALAAIVVMIQGL